MPEGSRGPLNRKAPFVTDVIAERRRVREGERRKAASAITISLARIDSFLFVFFMAASSNSTKVSYHDIIVALFCMEGIKGGWRQSANPLTGPEECGNRAAYIVQDIHDWSIHRMSFRCDLLTGGCALGHRNIRGNPGWGHLIPRNQTDCHGHVNEPVNRAGPGRRGAKMRRTGSTHLIPSSVSASQLPVCLPLSRVEAPYISEPTALHRSSDFHSFQAAVMVLMARNGAASSATTIHPPLPPPLPRFKISPPSHPQSPAAEI